MLQLSWTLSVIPTSRRTFFVGDQMFFAQDRLDFVREALAAA
jgi:2-hydroxychromene-2-carboxylate isomerase